MGKLSKKEIKKKKNFHEKRAKFYEKKLDEIKKEERTPGFKWY